MKAFKDPGFQERVAMAQRAKSNALAQLRAKPPLDEAELAARAERQARREAKEAALRQAKIDARIAKEQAAIEAAEKAAAEALAAKPVPPRVPTAAELKAARDARYAARKNRKG